jgi:ribosome-associated toxin RatA of RatAB toxin-antitoxin module
VAEQAHERIRIDASPQRCYEVAIDFEEYPNWARDVKQANILERDDEGRGIRVAYRAAGLGKSFRYTLAYDYSLAPATFSWGLAEGEGLKSLDGTYRFEPDGDGTRVIYDLEIELAMPLPGLIKRRAAGIIMGTALRELKKAVESR